MQYGDYREDDGVYDHVLSTGMACHVGPKGLIPYVQQVRRRVRKGRRYMHHVIMNPWSRRPVDSFMGVAFCKKYVWPGFHWFCVGDHYTRHLSGTGSGSSGRRTSVSIMPRRRRPGICG
jgi:cyclopropane fatty-acyl-phospholipid synthase-like methyltransferase